MRPFGKEANSRSYYRIICFWFFFAASFGTDWGFWEVLEG
jgi:hypothetical protein